MVRRQERRRLLLCKPGQRRLQMARGLDDEGRIGRKQSRRQPVHATSSSTAAAATCSCTATTASSLAATATYSLATANDHARLSTDPHCSLTTSYFRRLAPGCTCPATAIALTFLTRIPTSARRR